MPRCLVPGMHLWLPDFLLSFLKSKLSSWCGSLLNEISKWNSNWSKIHLDKSLFPLLKMSRKLAKSPSRFLSKFSHRGTIVSIHRAKSCTFDTSPLMFWMMTLQASKKDWTMFRRLCYWSQRKTVKSYCIKKGKKKAKNKENFLFHPPWHTC